MPATAVLIPHPETPEGAVRSLVAEVSWHAAPRALSLLFRLDAAAAQLRLPAPRPVRRADGLWQHTCFEAFLRPAGADAYYEFDVSASGEWAAYHFASRRAGIQPVPYLPPPRVGVLHGQGVTDVSVDFDLASLDGLAGATQLALGLAAVIESQAGRLSYWALRHGAGPPDFHDPDSFTVRLDSGSAA